MFGKAVKIRHCPATVSAPAPLPVCKGGRYGRDSARAAARVAYGSYNPLETEWQLVSGKAAEQSASQETGPRRLNRFPFRGGRWSIPCPYLQFASPPFPRLCARSIAPCYFFCSPPFPASPRPFAELSQIRRVPRSPAPPLFSSATARWSAPRSPRLTAALKFS